MRYLKGLFFNFLIVFFANHVLPGIGVADQTKFPHLGDDLLFAIALGFLNSLIYPILRLIGKHQSALRIAIFALALNFAAYAVLKFLPLGIHIMSVEGYLLTSFFVSLGSFLVNYLEMKAGSRMKSSPKPPNEPPRFS